MPQSSPAKPQRALESAQGYLLLELPDAALRELREFVDADETPVAVHQLRGEALRMRGDFEDALESFQKVLPHVEHDLSVLMGMAWCFKRIGRLDKAIDTMKQAYRGSPKEAVVLYNLACYHSLAGNKDEALSWLGRAIRLDPSYRKLIPLETDFDSLRNDPDFVYLLQLAEPKQPKKSS
ncbi:MAG TPA: tetratricopeptide repeat protein [Planctomycetaceae bacterium]|nr:tetratricopeptide repeat protein [Planctomycetaceae bacterium]